MNEQNTSLAPVNMKTTESDVKILLEAIEVLSDFASTVGGSSSFWDETWPKYESIVDEIQYRLVKQSTIKIDFTDNSWKHVCDEMPHPETRIDIMIKSNGNASYKRIVYNIFYDNDFVYRENMYSTEFIAMWRYNND